MALGRRLGAPQRSSQTTLESTTVQVQQQRRRSGGCSLPWRGAPAVGEGRDGLVSCPWRGDPALENVAASGPTLEKAIDGDAMESTAAVDGVVRG
ncbi:unnamed protein product [Miscanthus lutarioriparius]|uniref:Uncharacterized protein n=1 Tax=Miscanthus lutarioriparius TaxID=422564 RepID=A0A811PGA8_9POAL|nr:unnamed protein product [Miscanthus lutarioriparius]